MESKPLLSQIIQKSNPLNLANNKIMIIVKVFKLKSNHSNMILYKYSKILTCMILTVQANSTKVNVSMMHYRAVNSLSECSTDKFKAYPACMIIKKFRPKYTN